ncbi:hypothetical protein EDD16DRAFT_1598776 [Pisolithus croceorrhizus]|nr:hypothetical protein EDD16DRAFT_1598776 [Pisolithus croceorrhizus]
MSSVLAVLQAPRILSTGPLGATLTQTKYFFRSDQCDLVRVSQVGIILSYGKAPCRSRCSLTFMHHRISTRRYGREQRKTKRYGPTN